MKSVRLFTIRIAVFLSAVLVASVFAEDPPSRAVRLQYIAGQVSVQPGGVNDWVAASINRPLATADRVWTDKDSRSELHLGTAAMRMNSETSLTLSNLTDNTVQVELDQGTLNLRIRRLYNGEIYEVDTPNLAFTIRKTGVYRFDVDSNGDTTNVTVFKGEGDATGDGPVVRVRSHEQARFSSGKSMAHQVLSAPGFDGFDDWCRVRDDREDKSVSAHYISPGVPGAEDLDDYGYWRTIPPYGPVWVPTAVVAGWAPYRYGHWIFVAPWGWTWVDDAPWGYAPFHYGRWVYYGGYWGWVPGPVVVRPVYAPALVAWVGGAHWGIGVSLGVGAGVGWFPLGYGEPYIPYYHCSRNYFQNVNVSNTHITNITYVTNNYYNNTTNIAHIRYVNQSVPDGVTVVHRQVMENSQPVARSVVHVDAREYSGTSVMAGPGVDPSRHSFLGVHAGAPSATPPATVVSRPVVSRIAPPARPAPFRDRDERDRDRDKEGPENRANREEPAPHEKAMQTPATGANMPPALERKTEGRPPVNVPPTNSDTNAAASHLHKTGPDPEPAQPENGRAQGRGFPHPPERGIDRAEPEGEGDPGQAASHRNDNDRAVGHPSQPSDNASGHAVQPSPDRGIDRQDHRGTDDAGKPVSNSRKNDDINQSPGRPPQANNDASGHPVPHPPERVVEKPTPPRDNAGEPAANRPKGDDLNRGGGNPPQPAGSTAGHDVPRPPQRGSDMPAKTNAGNQQPRGARSDDTPHNSGPAAADNTSARSVPRAPERSQPMQPEAHNNPARPTPSVQPSVQRNDVPARTNASVEHSGSPPEHNVSSVQQHNSGAPAVRSAPAEQHHDSSPPHESKSADKPAKQS